MNVIDWNTIEKNKQKKVEILDLEQTIFSANAVFRKVNCFSTPICLVINCFFVLRVPGRFRTVRLHVGRKLQNLNARITFVFSLLRPLQSRYTNPFWWRI